MKAAVLGVLGALACAVVAVGCAKAPDARISADARVDASASTGPTADAAHHAVPGLPMPQQFPRVVWDASAADASAPAVTR